MQARAQQYWIDHGVNANVAKGLVQKYAAQMAGARTLANTEARIITALQEVRGTASQVLDISEKIPRTQYKTLNDIYLAYQKGTGGKEVARLNVALETLVNDYAATLGRGSNQTTDSAKQHAREMLERGYSHGQMEAAVDQMLIDVERASDSIRKGLDIYLGLTKTKPYKPGDVLKRPEAGGGGGGGGTATTTAPTISGEQRQRAEQWLKDNPNHPDAAAVRKRLGIE